MKKLFFVLLLASIAFVGQAQLSSFTKTAYNPNGTVVDTGIDTQYVKTSGYFPIVTIQLIVTKNSGTVGGTSILQGSLDGVNYINTDTLTLSNVDLNTKFISKPGNPYWYYRVITTGSGTMNATASHKILFRK